jgi:hypothetical protein
MKWIANLLGFGALYSWFAYFDPKPGESVGPGSLVVGLVLALLAALFWNAGQQQDQREIDGLADKILAQVKNGDSPTYYLYLRPFSTTNKSPEDRPGLVPGAGGTFQPGKKKDFEQTIRDTLQRRKIPIIGLGKPGEAFGAGRILATEDEWQDVFLLLANSATGIVMIPSAANWTFWEFTRLVERTWLGKTVFVQLPNATSDHWRVIQDATRALGVQLSDFSEGGQFFTIGRSGKPSGFISLKDHYREDVAKSIEKLRVANQSGAR